MHFLRFNNNLFTFAESKRLGGYLFICLQDKSIFLAQRPPKDNDPNVWEGLGGHINKGESIEAGAKREVIEEGGSFPDCKITKTVVNHKDDGVTYTLFIANLSPEQKNNWKYKINHEHQDAKWFHKLPEDTHPELKKELISLAKP